MTDVKKISGDKLKKLKEEVHFLHVKAAIDEYNNNLGKYSGKHYRDAKMYEIVDDRGNHYPSKVILAIAFERATGIKCMPCELHGGKNPPNGAAYILKNILKGTSYKIVNKKDSSQFSDLSSLIKVKDIEKGTENLEGDTKLTVIKARVHQSEFRRSLLREYGKCCICGIDKEELLTASHIKPWVDSNSKEKVNGYNGLLLCPNHDKLFDSGFISFDHRGKILISKSLSVKNQRLMNIQNDMQIELSDEMQGFMTYHRKHIYKDK